MNYNKQTWIDKVSIANAERMTHMEDGISIAANNILPIGSQVAFAGSFAPDGWLICDGSEVSRTTYADLFNVIGTNYGEGDGSTTFNLPDKRSRTSIGVDSRDTDFDTIGKKYGEKEHTLTINEIPSHNHNVTYNNNTMNYSGGNASAENTNIVGTRSTKKTSNTGEGQPHNIVQPSEVDNWIIKAKYIV